MIRSEYRWGIGTEWEPYERVFKEDGTLIDELVNRLGIKRGAPAPSSARGSLDSWSEWD